VKDKDSVEAKKLVESLHGMQVKAELTSFENEGLRQVLEYKKTQKKKGKTCDLQQRKEFHGSAVMWSPRKFRESRVREEVRLKEDEQEKLQKKYRKELKASAALYKKQQAQEKREAREKAKKERENEKEKKAQEVAQRKQQREMETQATEARKTAQQSQKGQRTVSKRTTPKRKRVEGCTGGASRMNSEESPQAPPTKITRKGRNITVPKKFR
jgi:hypothetical protein